MHCILHLFFQKFQKYLSQIQKDTMQISKIIIVLYELIISHDYQQTLYTGDV